MDRLKLLREHSVFWSKLGFCYDPPRLDVHGRPICFSEDFSRLEKYHRDFYRAGVKLHTSILFSGWIGDRRYDYELTDRVLKSVFSCGEDLYYIPRIKLNAPEEWCRNHPADVFVFENGPDSAEEVRKLIGTPAHDILGYESAVGYYTAGAWKDDRPNIGGVVSNQSFASKAWLEDASVTLVRLLEHLRNSPYYDRIPAVQIAYGISGETCVWGRFQPERFGDKSLGCRQAFFDWGLKRYGGLAELRGAWSLPELTRENLRIPAGKLREPAEDEIVLPRPRICLDYDYFIGDVNVAACEHFCRVVKDFDSRLLTGSFYGYMMEVPRSAYTGHLNFERILKSESIDFLCAPKSYYRNLAGDAGGELAPSQSVNLQKFWLNELDNRTHLAGEKGCAAENFQESRYCMWREVCKTLVHDSGFWWMDLGGGWYDDPQLMAEVAEIERKTAGIRTRRHRSISQVLVLVDEKTFIEKGFRPEKHKRLYKESVRNIHACGLAVDLFRKADLDRISLEQYKVIISVDFEFALAGKKCISLLDYHGKVDFRKAFQEAGCVFAAPDGYIVFEDNRFRAVFSPGKECTFTFLEKKESDSAED